jgi:hypothetical protein
MSANIDYLKDNYELPPITQLGFVYSNMDSAISIFKENFNVEPFRYYSSFKELGYNETFYKKQAVEFDAIFAFLNFGSIEVEIIQPISGPTIYKDFLESGRQGLHHLGFDVFNDFDRILKNFLEKGFEITQSGRGVKRSFAYLDTYSVCGTVIEIIDRGGPKRLAK